jgi:hypothetical protein
MPHKPLHVSRRWPLLPACIMLARLKSNSSCLGAASPEAASPEAASRLERAQAVRVLPLVVDQLGPFLKTTRKRYLSSVHIGDRSTMLLFLPWQLSKDVGSSG